MGKGDQPLASPEELQGTFVGNGCMCTPECCTIEVTPACGGGICVYRYCMGIPIPFSCQYMMPCGNCYTDCDDEGFWTPDKDTISMGKLSSCGAGYVRKTGGAPPAPLEEMER